ncbi:MAG: patatin-like phospholipase family protein [Marinicellaceae bacterium]
MKVGLALGSGSARGMSHIGVIKALEDIGVFPEIIAGCSVGSLVGASYATSNLKKLEDWALSMSESKIRKFLKINISSTGFVNAVKLQKLFEETIGIQSIKFKDMDKKFGAVATNLSSGREVWLKKGSVHDALWSSMAFPGLFPSVLMDDQWLVDGGLVNPVPVSLCRALGADIVIAVNLNSDVISSYTLKENNEILAKEEDNIADENIWHRAKEGIKKTLNIISSDGSKVKEPQTFDVISNAINIMSSKITTGKLAGDPPDVLLQPRLKDIGLLQIYKAKETIEEGYACVKRMEEEIKFRTSQK